MSVRVYVEGGGDQRAALSECRRGFGEFFGKIVPPGRRPKVVACGGRNQTFDRFQTALRDDANEVVLLLVDSEGSVVPGANPWTHLQQRDGWVRPAVSTEDQAHLMVQCMESWFMADKQVLADYYGQGFNDNALPGQPDVEQIPKNDVHSALVSATKDTRTKGKYHKTQHGFDLLTLIDPGKVRQASRYAERLATALTQNA